MITAGSSASSSATSAGVSWGRSSSSASATSAIVIAGTPSGSSPSSPSSPMHSLGFAARARTSRSLRRSCGLQGIATAPIRKQASIASTHSMRLPTNVMTASPRSTPRAAIAPESPALRAISSPKCHSRRFPTASIATIPRVEAGARSMTSSMKFIGASLPGASRGVSGASSFPARRSPEGFHR